ncbi:MULTISPECIES: threonine ammonia-lyase IlvA [unclassified Flavobacterium]|uniref:threonine ammonia-lyase IlvA n=1 Tax=unclassified Flavobacterium TaxID=196869 RepID=UPI00129225C9|nr:MULTISPECIES: threonine ammonia-lyase IlvA [unclassified Flavobacterium]MQP52212.1 threonine ammonia-lyase IlvA [Flavobacterium sp. LMO9]MQP62282.1 threonine ammonia-lyase IlvA [Flavobacterium sp. LMO6]
MTLFDKIVKAQENLNGVVLKTPLQFSINLSEKFQASVYLKREDLQQVRSYKIRGAYNKISHLNQTQKSEGIVCASAGNHAQGVAYSCQVLQIQGKIYMPKTTPKQKIKQVQLFGKSFVEIVLIGDTFDDAFHAAKQFSNENELEFIHPFDDLEVIAGQGTIGLEILSEKIPTIDYLLMPVGGGGLAAGVSTVFKKLSPSTKIIGIEPQGAPSMQYALDQKEALPLTSIDKFVDGAAVKQVGKETFAVCKNTLDRMILVPEGKVCSTILQLYNEEAMVVEPAGALAIAALDFMADEIRGKNVVCVVSGSNNDIERTEEIKERSLIYEGLKHYFMIQFPQRPGALREFVNDVLNESDDITYFQFIKKNNRDVGPVVVGLEVKNETDIASVKLKMSEKGFQFQYLNEKEPLLALLI